jgi:hypothetical protein
MQLTKEYLMKAGKLSALLAVFVASQVYAQTPERMTELSSVWDLNVAADGTVSDLTSVSDLPESLVKKLEQEIRGWHFQPGAIDGKASATRTSLTLQLGIFELDERTVGTKVLSAETGARVLEALPPKYPAASIRENRGGLVLVAAKFDSEGRVTSAELHEDSPLKSGPLVKESLRTVGKWTVKPEVVEGRPVESEFIAPVCYVLHSTAGKSTGDCRWKRRSGESSANDGQALALSPEVTLQTAVEGKIL